MIHLLVKTILYVKFEIFTQRSYTPLREKVSDFFKVLGRNNQKLNALCWIVQQIPDFTHTIGDTLLVRANVRALVRAKVRANVTAIVSAKVRAKVKAKIYSYSKFGIVDASSRELNSIRNNLQNVSVT